MFERVIREDMLVKVVNYILCIRKFIEEVVFRFWDVMKFYIVVIWEKFIVDVFFCWCLVVWIIKYYDIFIWNKERKSILLKGCFFGFEWSWKN